MRYIQKGAEPQSLRDNRDTPDSRYKASHALRLALAHEQGFLCAFCMCRLVINPTNEEKHTTNIAHLISRKWKGGDAADQVWRRRLEQDYHNMVLACEGSPGPAAHCDEYQGNRDITIPLFNRSEMNRIQFSTSGVISHPNRDYDKQLNAEDPAYIAEKAIQGERPGFLNLNAEALVTRRRQRWKRLGDLLNKARRFNRNGLEEQVQVYSTRDGQRRLQEDCTYVLAQLNRSLQGR